MSGGPWKYDKQALEETSAGLATLKSDYESATGDRKATSSAFGFDAVSGAVEEFTSNWSHERRKQIDSLANAQGDLDGIIETYVAWDAGGVTTLNKAVP